jgi:hypothetical protein
VEGALAQSRFSIALETWHGNATAYARHPRFYDPAWCSTEVRDRESRVKRKLGAAVDRNADTNRKIDEAFRDYGKGTQGSAPTRRILSLFDPSLSASEKRLPAV